MYKPWMQKELHTCVSVLVNAHAEKATVILCSMYLLLQHTEMRQRFNTKLKTFTAAMSGLLL